MKKWIIFAILTALFCLLLAYVPMTTVFQVITSFLICLSGFITLMFIFKR